MRFQIAQSSLCVGIVTGELLVDFVRVTPIRPRLVIWKHGARFFELMKYFRDNGANAQFFAVADPLYLQFAERLDEPVAELIGASVDQLLFEGRGNSAHECGNRDKNKRL